MTIITDAIPDNERLRSVGYDMIPASWGESFISSTKEALIRSPALSLLRMGQIAQREGYVSPVIDPMGMTPPDLQELQKTTSRMLTEAEWRESEYFREGLSFPNGVREEVAGILAERKDNERARQDVFLRSKGFFRKGSMLATQLAASVLDPINVASAFVPVVGQARALGLVARFGKTTGRAITGAIEGVAGAAMVEPVVLAASKHEQADYRMTDSLINVAFGSVFGGGLHVGAGAVGDLLKKARPHTREAALRTAVGQVADGRPVEIEPILALDDRIGDQINSGAFEKLDAATRIDEPEPGLEPLRTAKEIFEEAPERLDVQRAEIEVKQIMTDLQDQIKNGELDPAHISEIIERTDLGLRAADDYESAVRAAVNCLARNL